MADEQDMEDIRALRQHVADINRLAWSLAERGYRTEGSVLDASGMGSPRTIVLEVTVLKEIIPPHAFKCSTCEDGTNPRTEWPAFTCPDCGTDCLPF